MVNLVNLVDLVNLGFLANPSAKLKIALANV